MYSSLRKRVLTAVIGVPLIILFLLSPTPVVTLVVMAASIMSLYEFYGAVGIRKQLGLYIMGIVAAVVIPLAGYLKPWSVMTLVYIYVLVLFVLMIKYHKVVKLKDVALLVTGLIYIPYFLSNVIYIRSLDFGNIYIWLVFIGAFMTDTFAYFVGCKVGGKKLCPNISPKKTVAGAIGGLAGCGICFVVFGIIINVFFTGALNGGSLSLIKLFVLGLLCAVVSELGDLIASVIKREFEIKDFGNLLPGHGGILDRCDSIILVAPAVFLFISKIGILL